MPVKHLTQTPPSHLGPSPSNSNIPRIPSIRLISATPSAHGLSSTEGSTSLRMDDSFDVPPVPPKGYATPATPWDNMPPPPPIPSTTTTTRGLKKSTSKLLPKSTGDPSSSGAKLVPKKSKLRILGSIGSNAAKNPSGSVRNKDLSDVLRRVNNNGDANASQASLVNSSKLKGGFEIYVDPAADPDMDDVVVVRKQKSRAALDDMGWGPSAANGAAPTNAKKERGVLGEVTNTNATSGVGGGKKDGLLKVKGEDEQSKKWWSIGRGRKDSKDKEKGDKENASRAASPLPMRSQTPDPFKQPSTTEAPRTRFNSLDAGVLLGLSSKKSAPILASSTKQSEPNAPSTASNAPTGSMRGVPSSVRGGVPAPPQTARSTSSPLLMQMQPGGVYPATQARRMERIPTPPQHPNPSTSSNTYSRSATPTFGGLLAPPAQNGGLQVPGTNAGNGGSIAVRAMRSVKSFAKIGSWAGVKVVSGGAEEEFGVSSKDSSGGKEKKDAREGKETRKESSSKEKKEKKKSSGTVKEKKAKNKASSGTMRLSTSSFEAGHLSASPPPAGAAATLNSKSSGFLSVNDGGETVSKKRSILGLGLPSSMRLPNMRSGSTASSVLVSGANSPFNQPSSNAVPTPVPILNNGTITSSNRLSVDSAINHRDATTGRRASVQSTASSLRPVSITSTISGASTASSGAHSRLSAASSGVSSARMSSGSSVRWDEEGLERARAETRREKKEKEREKRGSKDSKRSLEGRRRTGIVDVFPEIAAVAPQLAGSTESKGGEVKEEMRRYPIVTIEEATADGHGEDLHALIEEDLASEPDTTVEEQSTLTQAEVKTPVKKPRARPLSEQLLGRQRPVGVHEDGDGVLSILSAATNDLAQLINNLDLEATPATPDMTPLKPSSSPFSSEPSTSVSRSMSLQYTGSPKKHLAAKFNAKANASPSAGPANASKWVTVRSSVASISSLRPYGQANNNNNYGTLRARPSIKDLENPFGKAVAIPEKTSLAELRAALRPVGSVTPKGSLESSALASTTKPAAKERGLPSPPPPSFVRTHKRTMTPAREPEAEPVLAPLKPRVFVKPKVQAKTTPERVKDTFDGSSSEDEEKYKTLRAPPANMGGQGTFGRKAGVPSELTFGSKASTASKRSSTSSRGSSVKQSLGPEGETRVPISRAARRILGMSGTMGASDGSAYPVEGLDESDPDSDVPEELRDILRQRESQAFSEGGDSQPYGGVVDEDDFDDEDMDEEEYRDDSSFTGRLHYLDSEDMTMDSVLGSHALKPAQPSALPRSSPFLAPPPQQKDQQESLGVSTSSQMTITPAVVQQAQRVPVFRAQLISEPSPSSNPPFALSSSTSSNGSSSSSSVPPSAFRRPQVPTLDLNGDFTDCGESDGDNTTKHSFDFTGELAKLNESGASDRRSFVEQLESAFKTPAKVDLRADFGIGLNLEVPPLPPMPANLSASFDSSREQEKSKAVEESMRYFEESEESVGVARAVEEKSFSMDVSVGEQQEKEDASKSFLSSSSPSKFNDDDVSVSRIVDVKQPSLELPTLSSSTSSVPDSVANLKLKSSVSSTSGASTKSGKSNHSVEGELNRSFKFGGSPSAANTSFVSNKSGVPESPGPYDSLFDELSMEESVENVAEKKPMTLSDIIPPPSHVREISFSSSMLDEYEDSALKSLIARVADLPQHPPQQQQSPEVQEHQNGHSQDVPENVSDDSHFPRERTISTGSSFQGHQQYDPRRLSHRMSNYIPLTRPSSGVSFGGLDSFDEVRRGFEFNDQRPGFYASAAGAAPSYLAAARSRAHRRAQDSVFSIASVSSYGRVLREGAQDPFDYGTAPPMPPLPPMHQHQQHAMPSLRERSFEEEGRTDEDDTMLSFEMSTQVDDTFSFLNHRPVARRRVDSDASDYYFNSSSLVPAPAPGRGHRRRDSSNLSVTSISGLPPVSMYNRSFHGHHRRNSSVTSASSVALSYAHGGVGGRAIMARHRRELSVESVGSDMSSMSMMRQYPFARPGLGEKMFDVGPLEAIAGSPSQSISGTDFLSTDYGAVNRTSGSSFDYYDSILDGSEDAYRFDRQRDSIAEEEYEEDGDERRSSMSDSLFDKTGVDNRTSVSSDSVFGEDDSGVVRNGLLPGGQFRPLSVISLGGPHSPMKEDDTMISMIGGGHVRRRSVGSMIEASPCVRMEKKPNHRRTARMVFQEMQQKKNAQPAVVVSPPAKTKTIELKPSIASTSSFQFGGERMIQARHGLLERQSLEESALIASGEDMSLSYIAPPVFTRPSPTGRNRSSTCSTATSVSSGRDTPPLSPSEGSVSGGSFSSIDMPDMIHSVLSNTTNPVSTIATARARARDHGHGHRRRYSKAQHLSRSSVYETIEEEFSSDSSSTRSVLDSTTKKLGQAGADDSTAVYVVGSDTESIHNPEETVWDDERGIVALRKFYHLKDEAQSTVRESQRTWIDTPFSLYAVQAFEPPRHPEGMKALLEHSVHTFGPLPAELRRIRSRKNSRPSPYPPTRFVENSPVRPKTSTASKATPVLKEKSTNAMSLAAVPSLGVLKPMSPFVMNITDHSAAATKKSESTAVPNKLSNGPARPRVPSAARRSALGWSKRSNGAKTSTDKKENVVGEGSIVMTPGESLRLNRPRPRAGRTPASQARAVRI